MQNTLDKYRIEIDIIDEKIVELINQRLQVVKKIGEYKKEHQIEVVQNNRWQEVLGKVTAIASQNGISPEFIQEIWDRIHKEAVRIEKQVY